MSENIPRQPTHPDKIQLEGLQCDCSLQGSPRGGTGGYDPIIREHHPFILESFFYADADTERLIPYYGDFLLDSGAFTFMQGKGGSPNWDEYVERYADFINRNKVEKYFELDIASAVMYYVANMADIYIFNRIKQKTEGKALWLRNNISTVLCNCLENFGFIGISFAGIYDLQTIITIAVSTSIIEALVAICDTPFLYVARHISDGDKA